MAIATIAPEAVYFRFHGVHRISTVDHTPVSALSAATWSEFQEQLEHLPPTTGLIVSPELMTVADYPLDSISLDTNRNRLGAARELSQQHPDARLVIGGVHRARTELFNSAYVFQDGELLCRADKDTLTGPEESVFTPGVIGTRQKVIGAGKQILICSELPGAVFSARGRQAGSVDDSVKTVIVSACWGVSPDPQYAGMMAHAVGEQYGTEEYFRRQLQRYAGEFFQVYPQAEEIVVVDRAPIGSQTLPFNAHFRRSGADT